MSNDLFLREVVPTDLPVFFDHQQDPRALRMAAFTAKDPSDRAAFDAHWQKILADDTVVIRTVVVERATAGHVLSYETDGKPEVSYWIGRPFWGRGIATRALEQFLAEVNTVRPIYARVAADNAASIRVLEKCGFRTIDTARGFAKSRGQEIDELNLELTA